jgi:uncharacterized protein
MGQLLDQVTASWKEAMKSGDATRKETLAMVRAAVKNAQIDSKEELSEEATLAVIEKEAKKRREAAEEFDKANRSDLADKERAELAVLAGFLPEQISDAELQQIVSATVSEVGASSPKDMGKVMSALLPKISGRADGKKASALVRAALS